MELLCKPIDLTKPVWKSKEEINTILEKINNIYKDINKNNLDKISTSNNSDIKSENNIDIKNYNNNIREKTKDIKLTKFRWKQLINKDKNWSSLDLPLKFNFMKSYSLFFYYRVTHIKK